MRQLIPLILPLLLGCEPPEPANCFAAESIDAWNIATNRKVATTAFPSDACGRRTEVVADLLPGGEVTISRAVPIPTGYVRPYVEVDSGATAACAQITVSLDAASHVGPVASFAAASSAPTAAIRAAAQERCLVRLRPRLQIGDGP
jgi:hypothetical protein